MSKPYNMRSAGSYSSKYVNREKQNPSRETSVSENKKGTSAIFDETQVNNENTKQAEQINKTNLSKNKAVSGRTQERRPMRGFFRRLFGARGREVAHNSSKPKPCERVQNNNIKNPPQKKPQTEESSFDAAEVLKDKKAELRNFGNLSNLSKLKNNKSFFDPHQLNSFNDPYETGKARLKSYENDFNNYLNQQKRSVQGFIDSLRNGDYRYGSNFQAGNVSGNYLLGLNNGGFDYNLAAKHQSQLFNGLDTNFRSANGMHQINSFYQDPKNKNHFGRFNFTGDNKGVFETAAQYTNRNFGLNASANRNSDENYAVMGDMKYQRGNFGIDASGNYDSVTRQSELKALAEMQHRHGKSALRYDYSNGDSKLGFHNRAVFGNMNSDLGVKYDFRENRLSPSGRIDWNVDRMTTANVSFDEKNTVFGANIKTPNGFSFNGQRKVDMRSFGIEDDFTFGIKRHNYSASGGVVVPHDEQPSVKFELEKAKNNTKFSVGGQMNGKSHEFRISVHSGGSVLR